ncbi:MAG: rRNA maturation RNase YbeY, partial [Gammaproteobacteria bacterium]|nr:rRNA maturation RNase YbeY [Gammaproteobacteria bacterium]
MLTVDINAQAPLPRILSEQQLVCWAKHALLGDERGPNCELAIAVVDEPSIRELNKNFRAIDKPTNVLAFAGASDTPGGNQHLGDIVICAPVIEREAIAQH